MKYRSDDVLKPKFKKLLDLGGVIGKNMMKTALIFAKIQLIRVNQRWDITNANDFERILRKLAWILPFTIHVNFRRIYMESSEQNFAYISPPAEFW